LTVGTHLEKTVGQFQSAKLMFGRFKRLHFVGIGGAGMSGIAEILHNLGYKVTGSDATPSEVTAYLDSKGIRIFGSHASENVREADVVVISSAISESNPEIIEARAHAIPVIKRAEMLGELMRLKFSIGIAGTHGKTTTTSMIGRIFTQANLKPTLIVGGVVAELGTGASLGTGDYLIAEADEYDKSFLAMFPSMAVVLNIEPDHLECYNGMDDLRNSFLTYMNRVPFYGSAIISADDPNTNLIRPKISRPYASFGFGADADYRAVNISMESGRTLFSVYHKQDLLGEIILRVPGKHNIANALAAVATANELDVPFAAVHDALRGFRGVGRRFEIIAEVNGVLVVDDYAHHPTEIGATLAAARVSYPGRRVIAVFQPHLFSRTQQFAPEFAAALSHADQVILTDIYPAREQPISGVTSEMIKREAERLGHTQFAYVGVKENALPELKRIVKPGDVVITIGAGSITYIKQQIVELVKGL
jgi:UDP-N-acetylmuramate--alanine ligase